MGAGIASLLAVATIVLWLTGQLALYINPSSYWFAVPMAFVVLIGAVLSFALPLGAEADHGHDHGAVADAAHHDHDHDHDHPHDHEHAPRRGVRAWVGLGATAIGGAIATAVAVAIVVVPPASLSAELAQSRNVGAAPLFAGSDTITLASTGDTATFGVGDWASVFATATSTEVFEGRTVSLIGFVTPAQNGGAFDLTRLVITHCVIDAQTASLTIAGADSTPTTGQWVDVKGTVRAASDTGKLEIVASSVTPIAQPQDPYEY